MKDGKHVTSVLPTYEWNVTNKDTFMSVVLEITGVVEPVVEFLLSGKNINIFTYDDNGTEKGVLTLNGANTYANAIVPLGKALGIELDAALTDGNAIIRAIVDGVFSLLTKLENYPLSTILELVGSISFFIANDGVKTVIESVLSPILGEPKDGETQSTGLLGLFTAIIGESDINALLKKYVKMDLNDIKNIAGSKGDKLVELLNKTLGKLVAKDNSTGETTAVTQYLKSTLFLDLSKVAVKYDDNTLVDGDDAGTWHVDKADTLMFLLQSVLTDDILALLSDAMKKDGTEPADPNALDLGAIIKGLAGKQDEIVDIIEMLLNDYTVEYMALDQTDINKIPVTPTAPMTKDNIKSSLAAIDGIIPAVLGLVMGNGATLESVVNDLVANADLPNLLMNILVPALAKLEEGDTDINEILGYVKEITNIDLDLSPKTFANRTGSMIVDFVGKENYENTTWKQLAEKYTMFKYTYTDADKKEYTYYDAKAGLTKATIDGTEYTLTAATDDKGQAVSEIHYDWNVKTLDDLVTFVTDLLAPFDIIFRVLLSGEEVIVLEETVDGKRGADVRIKGGNGYNTAIIPLLEAFGITPVTEERFFELAKENKSSVRYILEALVGFVKELCGAPVQTLLEKLANIFYFIGNGSLNSVVQNLIAPVNVILKQVDDVVPIAVKIDTAEIGKEGGKVLQTYIGKAHGGIPAGVTLKVAGEDLANLVNGIIGSIKINDQTTISLNLDLNWLVLAAKMAKADAEDATKVVTTKTRMTDITKADGTKIELSKYKNITGDAVDTFITLLDTILTPDNTEGIANLIKALIPADLDPQIASVVYDVLNNPDAIKQIIGVLVRVLSGDYTVNDNNPFDYAVLAVLEYAYEHFTGGKDSVTTAIDKLDKIVSRAVPQVVKVLGNASKADAADATLLDKLAKYASDNKNATLKTLVDWLLNDQVFNEATFDKLLGMLVPALGKNLTADLTKTLKDLLGIDLAPEAFAAATKNPTIAAFLRGCATWADVEKRLAKNEDGKYTFDPAFAWGTNTKDAFIDMILDMLKPLEKVLAFVLTGKDLDFAIDGVKLKAGNAYENALNPLFKALGLGGDKSASTANEAVKNIVDYVFTLVNNLCDAPFTTILSLVSNLAYFVASNGLDPFLNNLVSPILGILDLLNPIISREQLDTILKGLIKLNGKAYGLTDLLEIGKDGGKKLVELLNNLLGIQIKNKNGDTEETVYVVKALPENFFTEFAQYALNANTAEGKIVGRTAWTVDKTDALMYILKNVLSEDFLNIIFKLAGIDTTKDIGATLITLAGKQDDLVDVILMLLNNYTFTYKRIAQAELDKNEAATYFGKLDNTKANNTIKALDPILKSVIGMLGKGDLKTMINGMLADADLGNTLVNALVPVLAGMNLDDVLKYVKELTNLDLDLSPANFKALATNGSKLAEFIGDAKTWADVAEPYSETQYKYTYTDGTETKEYFSANDSLGGKTVKIGEGDAAKDVVLTAATEEVTDKDGNTTTVHTSKVVMKSTFDWNIKTKEDIANLVCDLLAPLDVVFQILLSGKQIIALEDVTADRADIRINGGYGYNTAIVPLLEAFGIAPKTQAQYDAQVKADGSSLKYILNTLFAAVDTILDAPVEQLFSRLANIFYFIGSDGINTIADNLIAPVNALLKEVNDVYPIAIAIDLGNTEQIVSTYIGTEAPAGLKGKISVNISGAALATFINNAIGNLVINGTTIKLSLDLDWNKIAAQMAKRDESGNIIYNGTAQDYTGKSGEFETGKALKNITGDAGASLVTLVNVLITDDNAASIKSLVESLLKDAELSDDIKNLVSDILENPAAIKNLIAVIAEILTGDYDLNTLNMVYKYLGVIDWNKANLDNAIPALDRLVKNAFPVIVNLVGDTTKAEDQQNIIDKYKATVTDTNKASLEGFVSWVLSENVFTDAMMGNITGALVKALGSALTADLTKTLKDLLGIDLAPAAFANATGNNEFITYVTVPAADEKVGVTWADVLKAHSRDTGKTDDEGNKIIAVDNIFTGISNKQTFMKALTDMLTPLESVLAFLLRGQDLQIAVEGVELKGNDAYSNVFKPLFTALGLTELGVDFKEAKSYADMSAVAAVSNVADYVFALVDELCDAPFTTLLTVVANLSYFIANDNVERLLNNLVSPVLGIVDALSGVISRDQIDTLLKSFVVINGKGYGLTDLLKIAGNRGANLVELINGLLGNIKITDKDGNEVYVLHALDSNFFASLAKAAIKVDEPTGTLTINEDDVTKWHTELGDTIMFVLKSLLTEDFLTIISNALGLEEKNPDVAKIILSLAGKEEAVADLLVTFLNKHLVEYVPYNQPQIKKEGISYSSADAHKQLNEALGNLDGLIPVIFGLIESINASSLKELVYGKILTDDIANTLISTVVKLLAGLPAETIDQVLGYVRELTTLQDLDISPAAFAKAPFGSQLKQYIGDAETWADVWNAHSRETSEKDADGNAIREAIPWAFGIHTTGDLLNLVSDLVQPLSDVLALILMGGTERAEFEATGEHHGKYIAALEEIAIMGGNGYNYAIIPLLELLGAKAPTQEEYEASVAKNHGNTLYPVLKTLLDRVDEILDAPISNVLDIFANLFYVIGNDNIEVIVQNLIAPINSLIKLVDPIFPIAININLGNIGVEGAQIVETYIGKTHGGIGAGIQLTLKGTELADLLNSVLGGIAINGKALGIKLDLDWLKLASKSAADKNSDLVADTSDSAMSIVYDIYNGLTAAKVAEKNRGYAVMNADGTTAKVYNTEYINIVGDRADTFVTLLELILTEENVKAIKEALGKEDGFGEPIDSIIDAIVDDPSKIIDIIISLLGGGKVSYIPIQNRDIKPTGVDYRTYFTLTEANADIIADNLDAVINNILSKAKMGSIKDIVTKKYITNAMINTLLDKLVPLLGGDSVAPILEAVKNIDIKIDGKHLDDSCVGIDLTALGFAKKTNSKVLKAKLNAAGAWNAVGSFSGTDWGFTDGDISGFIKTLAEIVAPLGPVLKLFLAGEGSVLSVLDIVKIGGSNGYDYGIIPILEAFGLTAEEVKTLAQYKKFIAGNDEAVLGYVLERVGYFADKLLSKPVETLLTILPNLAYFISNEGVYLAVRNILAPVYAVLEVVAKVYKLDFISEIKVEKLLHNIDFRLFVAGNKYDFRIPEIDFYKLAEQGGDGTKQVATSRTKKANSFNIPVDPYPYINDYGTGKYDSYANKTTQTYVVSDKGDTLTLVLTWALEMFGDAHNREALVQWLTDVFELQSGMQQTVRYGINQMFDACSNHNVPDIIVSALFQGLGIGIVIDKTVSGQIVEIQKIFENIFDALSSNEHCAYATLSKVMESLIGDAWNKTVGSDDDYHGAVDEGKDTLTWFQRLLAKIKAFFQKIFSIFR